MKLINPSQISGEIMNLIDEADHKVVIVSPFTDLRRWDKMRNKLQNLLSRNISLEYYSRIPETPYDVDRISELSEFGITPTLIDRLHSKIYFNDKHGIITSMNLIYGSDARSLDIGYKTETEQEYNDLMGYYQRFIKSHKKTFPTTFTENTIIDSKDWLEAVANCLRSDCRYAIKSFFRGKYNTGHLEIKKFKVQFTTTKDKNNQFLSYNSYLPNLCIAYLEQHVDQFPISENIRVSLKDSSSSYGIYKFILWELKQPVLDKENIWELIAHENQKHLVQNIAQSILDFVRLIHNSQDQSVIKETFN